MEQFQLSGWWFAVYLVGAAMTALGGREILALIIKRKLAQQDMEQHQTIEREGKEIDADQAATRLLFERVNKLEQSHEKLQSDFNTLTVEKTKLEGRNEHLEAENVRLDGEVKSLRIKMHDLSNALSDRDLKIRVLEEEVKHLTEMVERLTRIEEKR